MAVLQTNELLKENLSRKNGLHRLTDEETEAIKKVVLEAALDVIALCDENGIPYMLGGGSALGAVRHGGFIPWDDDIDLNIPRKYIPQLIDAIENRYPDKYYIEAPLFTEGYLSSFIQVHRRNTVFQEYRNQKKENCGIKLDVFIIENTYNNAVHRVWHGICVQAGLLFLSCYRMYAWRDEFKKLAEGNRKASAIMFVKRCIGALFSCNPKRLYRSVQKKMAQCTDEQSEYITIPSGRNHFFGELYQRDAFMQTLKMEFEGNMLCVTCDYKNYLTRLYGNYMEIPPEEKREHHVLYDLKLPGQYEAPKMLDKRQIQQVLTGMLDDFADYCQRHGLRYYLVGGTLLGAVRHQGFIPWDDDIDVGMPRKDYERFLELVKQEPVNDHLQVICGEEGTLSNPYCELIHTRTRLERNSSQYIRNKCQVLHLFLDIFPQDGWPENEKEALRLFGKMKKMRYMIQNARAKIGKGTSLGHIIAKTPIVLLMRCIGYQRVINKMDRIATQYDYDQSKYVGAITYGIYGVGERCLHDEVVAFTKVTFEGKQYYAPGCYDQYLKQIFGDYMTLPPVEKRVDHKMKVWAEFDV